MHSLLKRGGKVKMTTSLLDKYSIALESTSDLNRRILKENRELQAEVRRLGSENAVAIKDEEIIISLEDRIRDLKADLSCKDDCIMDLKAENESLQDQLKDAVNDYESLLNSNGVK